MPTDDSVFETAISAVQEGDLERARDLLTRLLKHNPEIPEYWLWMSAVVDTERERLYCLKEAAKLDPRNEDARLGLQILGQRLPDESRIVPWEDVTSDWAEETHQKTTLKFSLLNRFSLLSGTWKITVLVLLLILVVMVFVGVASIFSNVILPIFQPEDDLPFVPVLMETITPTATEVRFPLELDGPTPLVSFIEKTYTPTPLYVSTPHSYTEDYRSAMFAYRDEDWERVLFFIENAIEVEPDLPDLYFYKGEALRHMESLQEAAAAFQQSMLLDADFGPAQIGLAMVRILQEPENTQTWIMVIEDVLETEKEYLFAWLYLADYYYEHGMFTELKDSMQKAGEFSPESPEVFRYYAEALLSEGNYNEAMVYAEKARELDITILPAYRLLGHAYIMLGDPQRAIKELETFLLFEPDDIEANLLMSYAVEEDGDPVQALDMLEELKAAYPENITILSAYAEYEKRQGQPQEALKTYYDALFLDPENPDTLIDLGILHYELHQNYPAYAKLTVALRKAETDADLAEIYYYRAQILENLNRLESAAEDWEALLDLPTSAVSQDRREMAENHLDALSGDQQ